MGRLSYRLDALNFFLADVRGGLGAFVSVFLVTAASWTPAEVGVVLTLSGLIGIAFHTPVGAMIDAVRDKRTILIGAVVLLAVCAIAIERRPSGPVVFTADVVMAVLGGVFAPTVAALTLGLFPDQQLAERFARNAVWDRIGNLTNAALVGIMGWVWTQHTTFYLIPVFAAVTTVVVLTIPASAIDHDRARGFVWDQINRRPQPFWRLVWANRPLLLLAMIAAVFHFANASMLPLVGQKLALANPGSETALLSACIIIAQASTIPAAHVAGCNVKTWGLKAILATACLALVLRGWIFATTVSLPVLLAAQILDGIAAGLWDVVLPLFLARIVAGSGRYSASRGVVGTVQGIGGSISNAAAGALVVWGGYPATFAALAITAGVACVLVATLPRPDAEIE
jgi:hypothetical protein